jgi:hypothetical protein
MAEHSDFLNHIAEKTHAWINWAERAILIGNVAARTSLGSLFCLLHRSHLAISEKLRPAISVETIRGDA